LIARLRRRFPAATACLKADLEECVMHLVFPREHHKRIRTTNVIERTFEECGRWAKVTPRFPTEGSAMALIWGRSSPRRRAGVECE
jgi:transposase-like protein